MNSISLFILFYNRLSLDLTKNSSISKNSFAKARKKPPKGGLETGYGA